MTFNRDEKTIRSAKWKYTYAIQALKDEKIMMPDSLDGQAEIFALSVDGVHCRISEPRMRPSAKWYSHKFNGPGLAYELGISINESMLLWINGPFPAGNPDLQIIRTDGGLKSQVPDGTRVLVAERGYKGEPVCSIKNKDDTDEVKKEVQEACTCAPRDVQFTHKEVQSFGRPFSPHSS